MLQGGWGVLESDEAVVGLMARGIVDGRIPTFFWGQNYGGTAEAFAVAAVASVFGWSTLAIRVVALLLSAAAAILVWRVGRRMVGPVPGAAAALLFWLFPAPYVFWSLKLRGFYWAAIVAGLTFVLCSLRLADRRQRRDAVVAGLAAGVGWWSAPQIVVYIVPAVLWLLLRHRCALRLLVTVGLPAAVVGAAPWLLFNLRHRFVSLDPPELAAGASGTYVEHLQTFATKGLPVALGARLPWTEQWIPGGKLLYGVALAVLFAAIFVRRPPILPIALVVLPFVHAASPLSHYVGEGRYLVYYAPFLALSIAAVVRHRVALPILVAALSVLTLSSLHRTEGLNVPVSAGRAVPESFTALIADLEHRNLRYVYAEYWVGYRLTFESDERIITAGGRSAEYTRRVNGAERVAYVSVDDSDATHSVRHELRRIDVPWLEHEVGGFRVIVPARPVTPEQLSSRPEHRRVVTPSGSVAGGRRPYQALPSHVLALYADASYRLLPRPTSSPPGHLRTFSHAARTNGAKKTSSLVNPSGA